MACVAACSSPILLAETARAQGHVACVGDSITAGNGASSPATAYPAVLQNLLGQSFAVENDGRSGTTMLKEGDRSYWSTAEYTRSTAFAAGGGDVVIELGTNDSKPTNWSKGAAFLADCKDLVTHYLAAPGKPRVWVSLIPPAAADACCSIDGVAIESEIVPLLRTCAEETGATSIDVFGALEPYPQYFTDGVHPNDTGAALIAQTVRDALAKLPAITLAASSTSASAPVAITLAATPTAAYGKVEKVVFYEGDVVRKELTQGPWAVTLEAVPAGAHVYHAEVVETAGRTARSGLVTANVTAAGASVTAESGGDPRPGSGARDEDAGRSGGMDAGLDASGDVPNGCTCRTTAPTETGGLHIAAFSVLAVGLSGLVIRRRMKRR